MVNIDELKKLVAGSESITENEKKMLNILLPILKDDDLEKIRDIFLIEQETLKQVPVINKSFEEMLKEIFIKTKQSYSHYQTAVTKETEKRLHEGDLESIEKELDQL